MGFSSSPEGCGPDRPPAGLFKFVPAQQLAGENGPELRERDRFDRVVAVHDDGDTIPGDHDRGQRFYFINENLLKINIS